MLENTIKQKEAIVFVNTKSRRNENNKLSIFNIRVYLNERPRAH